MQAASGRLVELRLAQITLDPGVQSRAGLNEGCVADYAVELKAGAEFPPVVAYHEGCRYWLSSGFHRWHAHRKAGRKAIRCRVIDGTKRDAVLASAGANKTHGLQRSHEDKRRSVDMLLADEEWEGWSNRQIAGHCGVSEGLVRTLRRERIDARRRAKSECVPNAPPPRKLPPTTDPKDVPAIEAEMERLARKLGRRAARVGKTPQEVVDEQRRKDRTRRERGQPAPDPSARILAHAGELLASLRGVIAELSGAGAALAACDLTRRELDALARPAG